MPYIARRSTRCKTLDLSATTTKSSAEFTQKSHVVKHTPGRHCLHRGFVEQGSGIGTRLLVGRRFVLNDRGEVRHQEHGLEVIEEIVGRHDDGCVFELVSDSWCRTKDQKFAAIALTTILVSRNPTDLPSGSGTYTLPQDDCPHTLTLSYQTSQPPSWASPTASNRRLRFNSRPRGDKLGRQCVVGPIHT